MSRNLTRLEQRIETLGASRSDRSHARQQLRSAETAVELAFRAFARLRDAAAVAGGIPAHRQ